MLFRRSDFPEEGEIVLCRVESVSKNSVFVSFLEYDGLSGIIPISEIAPGRIRTIRDYVKEGMIIVCKVLRAFPERKHFELSLRRVSDKERKDKLEFMKQEQAAEKIVEFIAKKSSLDFNKLYDAITEELFKEYSSLYEAFYDIATTKKEFPLKKISQEVREQLINTVRDRIKPKVMDIEGNFFLSSTADNGIELIKEAFDGIKDIKAPSDEKITVKYAGSGKYLFLITGSDYKKMEEYLSKIVNHLEDFSKKHKLEFSVERKE
ncbi:MAG: translation initiation factor 2 subunit 1 [Candidatus Woesearchaeota archaeon]|nr:translation initiation factor 2 subunit 1 [Candidatus Woesearchaeota archaeon]